MSDKEIEIRQKIAEILDKKTISMEDVKTLSACWGALQLFSPQTKNNEFVEEKQSDIFPALKEYQNDHSSHNLTKLCEEVSDFCFAILASTKNDEEREIFYKMVDKLK